MNWLAIAALAWLLLVVPGAMFAGKFIKHPPQANTPAAGTSPVPGHPHPGEGHGPPDVHAPAPAPHGGLVVSIDIYADDRIVTTYHTQDRAEVNTGRCHDCLAESAERTDWDAELRRLADGV